MEKDILNYSPTVMFRGTPCIRPLIPLRCNITRANELQFLRCNDVNSMNCIIPHALYVY